MDSIPQRAIQLYSVRSHSAPLPDILRRVDEAGYDGVEFAHRFREEPTEPVADALAETGIEPVAVHADLSAVEDAVDGQTDLIERCRTVGCDSIVIPHVSSSHYRSRGSVRSLAERLRAAAADLADHGLNLGFHNDRRTLWPLLPDGSRALLSSTPIPDRAADHAQRAARRLASQNPSVVPSETPLWNLVARTEPEELSFEIEVAEVRAAGFDPTAALSLVGDRAEMVHLRDVTRPDLVGGAENVPHGEGAVGMERVAEAAADAGVDWIVYENELDAAPESKIDGGAALLDRLVSRSDAPRERIGTRTSGS
ncbi:sugar phosphate isomerase/epimerase family protein [Haloarcula salina]|uniref:sugar phosphate isomerase/epimerase family protein n=1 Tax=Haloarcula salina TaxID=1429914 RepID=UPI003C703A0A